MQMESAQPSHATATPAMVCPAELPGQHKRPLVLVVDDDPVTTQIIEAALAHVGFQACVAHDGEATMLKIREHVPDLILLDVSLPDTSGIELCRRLQTQSGLSQIPVIFISGHEELAIKVAGFDAGGVDYITKPLAVREVIARVRTHIRLKRGYESLAELQAERIRKLAAAQPGQQDEGNLILQGHAFQLLGWGNVLGTWHGGFLSTAAKVSDVSGRGVGMDVVKTNLDRLGGQVEISSTLGRGSLFRIKLPLTLTIIPALIVSAENERFAIPQINVEELLRIRAEETKRRIEVVGGTEVLLLRDRILPLLRLDDFLGVLPTYQEQPYGSTYCRKLRNKKTGCPSLR